MNTIINKSINGYEMLSAVRCCYPNALIAVDGNMINIDVNDKVKYTIWLKKSNTFEVIPQKAFWNRTFEMNAKAQEIAFRLADFFENGALSQEPGNLIPTTCPHCKSPNEKKTLICEWCGGKLI